MNLLVPLPLKWYGTTLLQFYQTGRLMGYGCIYILGDGCCMVFILSFWRFHCLCTDTWWCFGVMAGPVGSSHLAWVVDLIIECEAEFYDCITRNINQSWKVMSIGDSPIVQSLWRQQLISSALYWKSRLLARDQTHVRWLITSLFRVWYTSNRYHEETHLCSLQTLYQRNILGLSERTKPTML